MKKLIITEKKSVGQIIANVVNADENHDGYLEGNDYIVSWCRGHLISLSMPDKYGYASWNLNSLPIIPKKWQYEKIEDIEEQNKLKQETKYSTSLKKQIDILDSLFKRNDIESLIEATDAGREGELIFRLVYYYLGCKKPFERLWISSLEESSIKEGLRNLLPSFQFDNLYSAASCRARADWLFGINGTRLYSLIKPVTDAVTSVGRVQTPTLAMIVSRQNEIDTFQKQKYWVVVKEFDQKWKAETDKFENKSDAELALSLTENQGLLIEKIEKSKKKVAPPPLYSLSTLQQDCNKKFGFSAEETLNIAQSLYEKKLLTYPRTDSMYITVDMVSSVTKIIKKISEKLKSPFDINDVSNLADNSKVTDHFAIICTAQYAYQGIEKSLISENEEKVLHLVEIRMLVSVCPWFIYEETKIKGISSSYLFYSSGRKIIQQGFKEAEQYFYPLKARQNVFINEFPKDLEENKLYSNENTSVENRQTNPPKPYTEATLLHTMEKAGSKQMNEEIQRKGLGTSATRAEIIETLIKRKYIYRFKEKNSSAPYLIPYKAGKELIKNVCSSFKNIDTTVEWENALFEVEKGKQSYKLFDLEIQKAISEIINIAVKDFESQPPLGPCPFCGKELRDFGKSTRMIECSSCKKQIWRSTNLFARNKVLNNEEISKLLNGESISLYIQYKDKKTDKLKERLSKVKINLKETREHGHISFSILKIKP